MENSVKAVAITERGVAEGVTSARIMDGLNESKRFRHNSASLMSFHEPRKGNE
jgi:hypothetical protein